MTTADVLVLGGGPAGSATAIELRRLGISVAIAEARTQLGTKLGETLPSRAVQLLTQLDIAKKFQAQGHLSAQAVRSVWGSDELRDQLAIFDPNGPAWHLDRQLFDRMLLDTAIERGADILMGARVIQCERRGSRWQARLIVRGSAVLFNCSFLVDATGRCGFLGRRLGQPPCILDRLIGLSQSYPNPYNELQPWTLVESTGCGWWYTAPLPHGNTLAAFMTDADLIPRLPAIEEWLVSRLREACHTQQRLANLTPVGNMRFQTARSSFCGAFERDHWLPVGDAAISCDPLAGQGLCFAMETGIACAYAIAQWKRGVHQSAGRYQNALNLRWQALCRQRTEMYLSESRWPESPFWRRRHSINEDSGRPSVALYDQQTK